MPEQLKTITVLFADVTGSTQLGERLDPEAVRRVMERYFELANRIITRHGGTVEAREALTLCDGMDAPLAQGDACLDAAEVFWLAGDPAAAVRQAERAAGDFKRKVATVPLDRAVQFAKIIESQASPPTGKPPRAAVAHEPQPSRRASPSHHEPSR